METMFMQIVEQTHAEKVAMYKKLKKKALIEMLIECNRILENMPLRVVPYECNHEWIWIDENCTAIGKRKKCQKCGALTTECFY